MSARGIHLRYLVDDLRVVEGVGVFQKGTVALVPRPLAVQLIAGGDFEPVTTGPLARIFVVRIGQDTLPSGEAPTRVGPEELADLERELEEEERRLAVGSPTDASDGPDRR